VSDSADLPCLSLHAPWLWAIMHAGKDIENRGPTFPRRFRGQPVVGDVWLHASKWPGAFDPLRPLRGAAAIEWANEFSAVEDVPASGSLGWWRPSEGTRAALRALGAN
jgi:hypothetical protein